MLKCIRYQSIWLALILGAAPAALAADEPKLTPQQEARIDEVLKLRGQFQQLFEQGRYAQALVPAQQVLAIRKEVWGEKHHKYGSSLNDVGVLYMELGEYTKAEPLMRQAVAIIKNDKGERDPWYAAVIDSLANLYLHMGKYAEAKPLLEQAIAIRKQTPDLEYATSLSNLASLHRILGEYGKAEPLYRQAAQIERAAEGEMSARYAIHLFNLGVVYKAMGDTLQAVRHFRRALEIRREVLARNHPDYAASLSSLAMLYSDVRDYANAEPLFREALSIQRAALGEKHHECATTLNSLALLYQNSGNYAKAEPLFLQARDVWQTLLGPTHPSYATSLNNLALFYSDTGEYAKAEPLFVEARDIYRQALGEIHPEFAMSLDNLASFYASTKNWRAAAASTDRARHVVRNYVSKVLPGLSAREQVAFLQSANDAGFYAALSLAWLRRADREIVSQSAAWLSNRKGMSHEVVAQQVLLARESTDPQVGALVKQLQDIRGELAALVYAASKSGYESQRRQRIDELETQETALGRRIADATGEQFQEDPWIDVAKMRDAIPAGAVLIDIGRFDLRNFAAKSNQQEWDAPRYAAWITPPAGTGEIKIVDLGEAQPIDDAVQTVQRSMLAAIGNGNAKGAIAERGEGEAEDQLRLPLRDLAKLALDPLLKEIPPDTKQILLSPDAALWLVPWAALPTEDGKYAIEKYQYRYLVSGRDLVAQRTARDKTNPPVVFADPNYDLGPNQAESATRSVLRGAVAVSRELRSVSGGKSASLLPKVGRLRGTAAEAAAIKPKLASLTKAEPITYVNQYATEGIFKAVKRPQVLVLSTHGFFLTDQEAKRDERGRPLATAEQRVTPALTADGKPIENPLLRCGLLLAGCNQSAASHERQRSEEATLDDGILTGMEIVGTDLRGTELVMLSACETGLGQVRNGEGVAGLRQAFQLAGAKAVVATLWQIPDKESAQLVSQFFTNLAEGQSKAEALRNAQLSQIELHRQRYAAAHPFYWAAFTIMGE